MRYINWILNLRAYGAKLRDNTTSSGFISWSDDGQKLSYKSLEFTMNSLKWFLHDQVEEACQILHDLLLLSKGDVDRRAEHLPQIHLSTLKDDPTIHQANYSFLQDPRNEKTLGGHERFLLRQVRQSHDSAANSSATLKSCSGISYMSISMYSSCRFFCVISSSWCI
jgi:hypothetical protein